MAAPPNEPLEPAPGSPDAGAVNARDAAGPADSQRLRELTTLNAVLDLLNRPAEADDAPLEQALARLVELVGARAGWLFVSTAEGGDSHRGGFRLAARHGLPPALACGGAEPLRRGGCECQTMLRAGRLERGVNVVECSRLAGAEGDRRGLELHASVPLLAPAGPVGILNLATPGSARFGDETLALLAAAGKALGTALERQRLERRRTRDARYAAALEERQRLAQEMHDAVSQQLFAAQLALETLRAAGTGERGGDARSGAALERVAASLSAAQRDVRALIETLRPADLGCGLGDALARLAERVGGAERAAEGEPRPADGSAAVHLDLEAPDPDAAVADAAYRIAQEALGNALRHAGARNVWLRWRRPAEPRVSGAELIVDDDGRGAPNEPFAEGLGLPGMRRRAERVGAALTLGPAPAGGLRVRVAFPGAETRGTDAGADLAADLAADLGSSGAPRPEGAPSGPFEGPSE